MVNDKAKINDEIFSRDCAGRFIKNEDEQLESMTRPLNEREQSLIDGFIKKRNDEREVALEKFLCEIEHDIERLMFLNKHVQDYRGFNFKDEFVKKVNDSLS